MGKAKYLFWLIMGALSTVLAEVIAGSSPFPFFDAWGILVVFPLYTLHILVLSYIVFRKCVPTLKNLFLAGALFGLYEAYITKVLWTGWQPGALSAGGVAIVETLVLVLFWHPFLAFIVPLLVADGLTAGRRILVPQGLNGIIQSPIFWIAAFVLLGLENGLVSASPAVSMLSPLSSALVLMALLYLWDRYGGSKHQLEELLPDDADFKVLAGALALFYIIFGVAIRPEAIPGMQSQAAIWAIYAVVILLLYFNRKRMDGVTAAMPGAGLKSVLAIALLFGVCSAVGKYIPPLPLLALAIVWAIGVLAGACVLLGTAYPLLRTRG